MISFLLTIIVALTLAYALAEIAKKLSLPRVIGQILAGFIIGLPFIKEFVFEKSMELIFSFMANIGVILLFFFIGLEIDIKLFKNNFKKSFFVSFFNTIIPLLFGFLVSYYFIDLSLITSLIIGISLAVSSQAISLDILEELRLVKSKIGSIIISAGAVDDVFELLLISIILIIFNSKITNITIIQLILEIILFILFIIIFRFLVIPFILKLFVEEKTHVSIFTGALIIVLLIAYLSEVLGMSGLIGALLAGVFVKQILLSGNKKDIHEEHTISKHIQVISFGFLIPLFFVWVGFNTDIYSISQNWLLIIGLVFLNILGTLIGTIIGVTLSKGSLKEGLIVGFGIIPKGDTELIIASLALQGGLINKNIFSAITMMAFISTIISPIIFKYLVRKHKNN